MSKSTEKRLKSLKCIHIAFVQLIQYTHTYLSGVHTHTYTNKHARINGSCWKQFAINEPWNKHNPIRIREKKGRDGRQLKLKWKNKLQKKKSVSSSRQFSNRIFFATHVGLYHFFCLLSNIHIPQTYILYTGS